MSAEYGRAAGGTINVNFRDLDADVGLSNYHQPYNSTTSFVWSLPFGRGQRWASGVSPIVDAFIGGWQLAGINSLFAGEPVTITSTYDPRQLQLGFKLLW